MLNLDLPDNYYNYKLKGVVIHMGNADAGHYYSYIEEWDQNNKWFSFNDSSISEYNLDELADDTFGGDYKDGEYQVFTQGNKEFTFK